jgi:hypothetical protein
MPNETAGGEQSYARALCGVRPLALAQVSVAIVGAGQGLRGCSRSNFRSLLADCVTDGAPEGWKGRALVLPANVSGGEESDRAEVRRVMRSNADGWGGCLIGVALGLKLRGRAQAKAAHIALTAPAGAFNVFLLSLAVQHSVMARRQFNNGGRAMCRIRSSGPPARCSPAWSSSCCFGSGARCRSLVRMAGPDSAGVERTAQKPASRLNLLLQQRPATILPGMHETGTPAVG